METDNAEHDRIKDELAKQIAEAAYLAQPLPQPFADNNDE